MRENKRFEADIGILRGDVMMRNGLCKETLVGEEYLTKKTQKTQKTQNKKKSKK
jgi:hypothetical protein